MHRFFTADVVTSPDDVRKHLADPVKHWRKGYSAFELANSWFSANDFPPTVRQVMDANPLFVGARLIEAFFERKVYLETPGHPSQNDILVYAKLSSGFVAIAVEGKVKEPFDKYVRDKEMTPGLEARIVNLCGRLEIALDEVQTIRYQLLHRAVSAILEAERYGAEHALMLVHSFSADDTSFHDYCDFAALFGFNENVVHVNQIVGYKKLRNVQLHLGWVRDAPTVESRTSVHASASNTPIPHPEPSLIGANMTQPVRLNRAIQEIKQAIRKTGAIPKKLSTVSSNISLGFKKDTGGRDYKDLYDLSMRSKVASLGAKWGVKTALLVNFVVIARSLDAATRDQMLDEMLSS